ncbi:7tm 7 domain containing protein, partial [Asbolus verrucosus]
MHLILITFGEIASALVRHSGTLLYLMVNLYPRLIIGVMNITVYIVSMLTEKRFKSINFLFTQKMNESNQLRRYPTESDFSEKIRHLVSLHKILVKISKEINSVFSFQLLLCITMNFILLIGDLYTSMYIISSHCRLVFDMLKHCIGYIFDLFYIVKRSADLCEEANRTKVLLLGIKIDVEKEDERNSVIASALKLIQNKLEITACKLFNIDNALLFSYQFIIEPDVMIPKKKNDSKALSFSQILAPLTITFQILGMHPFTLKRGRLVYSKIKIVQTLIYVTICTISTAFMVKNYTLRDFAKAKTITFLITLRSLGQTSVMVLIFVFSRSNRQKLSNLIAAIAKIDRELKKLGLDDRIIKTGYQIRKSSILLLVLVNLILNILGEIYAATVKDFSRISFFAIFVYPRLVGNTMNITFYVYMMIIQERFKMINEIVATNTDNIKQVVAMHKILVDVSMQLNAIFSFQSLLWIACCFLLSVGDIHTAAYVVIFGLIRTHYIIFSIATKNLVACAFDLFYLAKRSTELCNE